jgi:hypothetical protein
MIHGSGPSVVGYSNLEAWVRATVEAFRNIWHDNSKYRRKPEKPSSKGIFIFTRETCLTGCPQ